MDPQNTKKRSGGNLAKFAFMALFFVGLIYILPLDKLTQTGPGPKSRVINTLPLFKEAVEMTVQGEILSNDVSMSRLEIEGANGSFIIKYRSVNGGCENRSVFDKVKNLKKNTIIEAYGKFDGQEIEVCSTKTYYINTQFCGDSVCTPTTCSTEGCPKAENEASCPSDCHKKPDHIYTVKELKKNIFIGQTYEVEGYVVDISCIECTKPQIMISDQNERISENKLSSQRMLLFVNKNDVFEKKTKYIFTILVDSSHSTIDSLPDIKLISYKLISDSIK